MEDGEGQGGVGGDREGSRGARMCVRRLVEVREGTRTGRGMERMGLDGCERERNLNVAIMQAGQRTA